MDAPDPPFADPRVPEAPEFSLVLGGALFRLWRRLRLAGSDPAERLYRRSAVLAAIAWLPLLLLTLAEGNAWGDAVRLTFVRDIEMHARLLIAIPLLVAAELIVHLRMRKVVGQFLARRLIRDPDRARFDAAIAAAMRLRDSALAEALVFAFVYGVGVLFVWRTQVALDVSSWYGVPSAGRLQPSLAGWWMGLVSLPLFQFLLLRWYFRLFIWARFLWQVSRIHLNLMPTHPDRCGGIGFLAGVAMAFWPLLLAQGATMAGLIANRIFNAGANLLQFKLELAGLVAILVFAVLGPLLVFFPMLAAAKRNGAREYGILAQRYALAFDQKWLRGGASDADVLIGSADIQSLADMGNSYANVKDMALVPFNMRTVLHLAVLTLLPVAPLLLTVVPMEELLSRLLKMVF